MALKKKVAFIGIKTAAGGFYPVLTENSKEEKRLILTTVHDDQQSVHIDLYKNYSQTISDALYIGSLVVDNIKARPKGKASVELTIALTKEGQLTANAVDVDGSFKEKDEPQPQNVTINYMAESKHRYEITDFGWEDNGPPPGLYEMPKEGFFKRMLFGAAILLRAGISN